MKVGFISLGCSKNLVVTENLIGLFKKHNYEITDNLQDAQIMVINTCGFILDAKDEAIKTILEVIDYKKENLKYLIVIGCLVTRYKKELIESLKEVDLFISIKEYTTIWEQITNLIETSSKKDQLSYKNRIITTGVNTAFLKIAEGCSNCCTYCAIPLIQGRYTSFKYEDILEEANILANKGYQEIVVIAQDTTKYGFDLYGKYRLVELLKDLEKIEGIKWIRFLYAYPESITEELIQTVKESKKILHYFDIPIQHISDNVLTSMNRHMDGKQIYKLINHIKEEINDVIIRTTLIAGFPNETEEDFDKLCEFVKNAKIDKLGCFAYSKEDKTKASLMKNQIPNKVKQRRKDKIMKLQQEISYELMQNKIGNTYEVLIEDITEDGKYFIARSYMDVKDEDGVIFIPFDNKHGLNEFTTCKIIDAMEYDLIAEFI